MPGAREGPKCLGFRTVPRDADKTNPEDARPSLDEGEVRSPKGRHGSWMCRPTVPGLSNEACGKHFFQGGRSRRRGSRLAAHLLSTALNGADRCQRYKDGCLLGDVALRLRRCRGDEPGSSQGATLPASGIERQMDGRSRHRSRIVTVKGEIAARIRRRDGAPIQRCASVRQRDGRAQNPCPRVHVTAAGTSSIVRLIDCTGTAGRVARSSARARSMGYRPAHQCRFRGGERSRHRPLRSWRAH